MSPTEPRTKFYFKAQFRRAILLYFYFIFYQYYYGDFIFDGAFFPLIFITYFRTIKNFFLFFVFFFFLFLKLLLLLLLLLSLLLLLLLLLFYTIIQHDGECLS